MEKLRVGVLMGGKSIEREVSFNSGRTICDHLDLGIYDIIPIFQRFDGTLFILPWSFLHRGKINDFIYRLDTEAKKINFDDLRSLVDFIYIAMHGRFAEDGTLQGFLEVLQIPYLGSKVMASALGMDKIVQKKLLKSEGINVPAGITIYLEDLEIYKKDNNKLFEVLKNSNLDFPLIIKPHKEGSSLGISVVHNKESLINNIVKASNINEIQPQSVLIEEYICGLEFSCIVITDNKTRQLIALPPTEIVIEDKNSFFDYQQKYMPGRATKFTPARCNQEILQEIKDACIKTVKILGITNIGRIDGFVTKDNRIIITDPNTLSGMAPSSFIFRQAAELNMSHTQIINHLIETELSTDDRFNFFIKQKKDKNMLQNDKMKVAVLLGGNTHEREISLESGRNVFYKLSPEKYEPISIFVSDDLKLYKINQSLLVRNSTKEIAQGVTKQMEINWSDLPKIADFVFIGLHGGVGENGSVQGTLEMLGIPYNGSSVFTSALCMDKYRTNRFLEKFNIDVPVGLLLFSQEWLNDKKNCINKINQLSHYPLIIKPHDDGCSVLVNKVKSDEQLIEALDTIFLDGKKFALIEECIMGTELTVGVIGNDKITSLPPSQVVVTQDILSMEEKFLPGAGENQTPAKLPENAINFVKRTMEEVYKLLGCKGYVRIDCFYQDEKQSPTGSARTIIIEVNTLPALTPATCIFHQAAEIGLKPMEFIDLIVTLGLEEHRKDLNVQNKPVNIEL